MLYNTYVYNIIHLLTGKGSRISNNFVKRVKQCFNYTINIFLLIREVNMLKCTINIAYSKGRKTLLEVFFGRRSSNVTIKTFSIFCAVFHAIICVPRVVAARPGQAGRERRAEVVDGPADDDVVVERDVEGDEHRTITHT